MRIIDSIFHLNIRQFKEFNKLYMIAFEVGGGFDNYDLHHIKLNKLIFHDMKDDALKELQNMRQNVFNAMNEYLPEVECLKCLVHEQDHHLIEKMTIEEVRAKISEVKKNSLQR